jgi:hypothetical protein
MIWGIGTPSSIERRPAQHGSLMSRNNSLRVMLTGVYDFGMTERRYSCYQESFSRRDGTEPGENLHPGLSSAAHP